MRSIHKKRRNGSLDSQAKGFLRTNLLISVYHTNRRIVKDSERNGLERTRMPWN